MADSSCTRDDRRERIVAECNAVRQALQHLLSEYMNNRVGPHAREGAISRPPTVGQLYAAKCQQFLCWSRGKGSEGQCLFTGFLILLVHFKVVMSPTWPLEPAG
ncbi:hypothetical protein AAFF_G00156490 [Aldrovandia affinis]|uniref:Uncharacterized protein n=1 Tax=Aldrovandia affinis TaxID=143900 RepID=A0AAD7RR21_9TELE|nr:hypothetical protein AAFF_G00156490 [Aldrovandia affinis]